MGSKKREGSPDQHDSISELAENRSGGIDAEVFSQPLGYVPKFPSPPRYIRVKAQSRKKRDLDRLFLSQILLEPNNQKDRRLSSGVDAKIVDIGEPPSAPPPPNSSKKRNNAIWAAEFSKDGKYLAAAGQDKKLRVWEVIASKEAREDEERSEAGAENEVGVHLSAPVFKRRLVREYDGHTAAILDLSWSKNNFLLSSSMDKTVRLYHVSRDDCLCAFKHTDFVTSIQFHPRDDRFFLAGSLDAKLRLWSIPDKNVAFWAQVSDMVTAVGFTPDGKTAIAGCLSGSCVLYHTEGLKAHSQIHVRSSRGRNTRGSKITGIDTIAIPRLHGPADVKILITSNDSRIRMYNLKDRALEMKFRGNENTCSQIRASFSDDGKYVICGSEDRKVYVWPTGELEKSDSDKRPVEVFEAHSAIVTTAVFAPGNAKRLLAQSGDPIYDLCNPPPVVLLSRADSMLSSPSLTNNSGKSDEKQRNGDVMPHGNGSQGPGSPTYLARHEHKGGHIIVTADFSGEIKVFRQDCAYQRRRDNNWETGSTFSRKILGRTGSLSQRTSLASSNRRASLGPSVKSPSTDRILNWRNSVNNSSTTTSSMTELGRKKSNSDRERSTSPRKSVSHRWSLRYNNTPLANSSSASSPHKPTFAAAATPDITLESPPNESNNPSPRNGSIHTSDRPLELKTDGERNNTASSKTLSPVGELSPIDQQKITLTEASPVKPSSDNPLLIVDGQSYMAWDVANTMLPMAAQQPRTPGLTPGHDSLGNPLSRLATAISRLSSDFGSSRSRLSSEEESETKKELKTALRGEETDEELTCKKCGSEKFRMVRMNGGGRGLKCRECGMAV